MLLIYVQGGVLGTKFMGNKRYDNFESKAKLVTVTNYELSTIDLNCNSLNRMIELCHPEKGRLSYSITPNVPKRRLPYCPFILCGDGTPFYEANLLILDKIENRALVNPDTVKKFATDLLDYLRFCEDKNLDMYKFPRRKLDRPTYQYKMEVQSQVNEGRSKVSGQRMVNAVVAFYRGLKAIGLLQRDDFENVPFEEMDMTIRGSTSYGGRTRRTVSTTDLTIKGSKNTTKDSEYIYDGGKLLPMTYEHQEMMLEDLKENASPELRLMVLIALYTGGRKQTICTLRLSQIDIHIDDLDSTDEVTILQGSESGSDTKNDKTIYLKFPVWLVDQLQIYAASERSLKRRNLSRLGDSDANYIFLTKRGLPYYYGKYTEEELVEYSPIKNPRNGDATRQQWVKMRSRLQAKDPSWNYKFHYLRATFGMNLVDRFVYANSKIKDPKARIPDTEILNEVMARMGHDNIETTQGYLNFRRKKALLKAAQSNWEERLLRAAYGS